MMKFFKKRDGKNHPPIQQSDWPTHVEPLDNKTFHGFINSYPLSVVDFWAPWCEPCKIMLPRLRRLELVFKGKVAFGRLNTEQEKTIAQQYDIMNIPHFCFFSHGKKLGSITGVKSVGDMKDIIETYLSKYSR